jgi:hypothetical protein
VQIPVLALLLLGACAAKLIRVLRARSVAVALGPTALFPLRLQRTVAKVMCAAEMSLGIALLGTAGRLGSGMVATAVRTGAVLLFVTAVGALIEVRQRRPDVGCGCFGDLSSTPVNARTIARAVLLALAAAATIGVPPVRLPPPGGALTLRLGLLGAEFLVIATLSPELSEALVRLGYSEPCELRIIPVERTLAALHASRTWRRHAPVLTGSHPVDMWRELCWRYLVYPGSYGDRGVEVVFAVYLRTRRPHVRAAVVDAVTGEALPSPHTLPPPGPHLVARPLPPHAVGMWPTVTRPATTSQPASGALQPPSGPAQPGMQPGTPRLLPAPTVFDAPELPDFESALPDSLYKLLALSTSVTRELNTSAEAVANARLRGSLNSPQDVRPQGRTANPG